MTDRRVKNGRDALRVAFGLDPNKEIENDRGQFTADGLTVYLTAHNRFGFIEDAPELPVHFGGLNKPVTVDHTDLRCSRCGEPLDPPNRKPAVWVAVNKVLHGSVCLSCLYDD